MFKAKKQYRTFIWCDLIGVKEALKNGTGIELLDNYWKTLDTWATAANLGDGYLKNQQVVKKMDVKVTVFSDTALISLDDDYDTASIYKCLDSIRKVLLRGKLKVYTILNRDIDLIPSDFPALGGTRGNFYKAAGSGPAWINLFLANDFVERNFSWHSRYSSYVVSKENLLSPEEAFPSATFEGANKKEVEIFAIG